jgi:hypothetical protein
MSNLCCVCVRALFPQFCDILVEEAMIHPQEDLLKFGYSGSTLAIFNTCPSHNWLILKNSFQQMEYS